MYWDSTYGHDIVKHYTFKALQIMGKTSKRYITTKILPAKSAPEIYNNQHGKRYNIKFLTVLFV